MPEPYESSGPPPEPPSGSDDQVHERVVKRVRDLGREGKIVIQAGGGADTAGGGSDTGWRQVFPLTYDFPPDHPEAVQSSSAD